MNAILFLLLIALILVNVGGKQSGFPFPAVNHLLYIDNEQALRALLLDPFIRSQNIVALYTLSAAADAYLSLYLGWVVDIFDDELDPPLFILYEQEAQESEQMSLFYAMLPPHSIIVSVQHGGVPIRLHSLDYMATTFKDGPKIIYHINHERPWCNNPDDQFDFLYPDTNDLIHVYSKYDLALRNYYYEPLLEDTIYVPVGAPHYGFLLGKDSYSNLSDSIAIPSSQRTKICYFRGRTDYDHGSSRGVKLDTEEHVLDRQELLVLFKKGLLPDCEIEEYNPVVENIRTGREEYEAYINRMITVRFALCPMGNNPETFRLYEVSNFFINIPLSHITIKLTQC